MSSHPSRPSPAAPRRFAVFAPKPRPTQNPAARRPPKPAPPLMKEGGGENGRPNFAAVYSQPRSVAYSSSPPPALLAADVMAE